MELSTSFTSFVFATLHSRFHVEHRQMRLFGERYPIAEMSPVFEGPLGHPTARGFRDASTTYQLYYIRRNTQYSVTQVALRAHHRSHRSSIMYNKHNNIRTSYIIIIHNTVKHKSHSQLLFYSVCAAVCVRGVGWCCVIMYSMMLCCVWCWRVTRLHVVPCFSVGIIITIS